MIHTRGAAFASVLTFLPFISWPACSAATLNAIATSDAFVAAGPTGNLSNNNYGGGGALAVAAGALPNGAFQSVIKFDLSGARSSLDALYGAGAWRIQGISLQLSSSPHSNPIYNEVSAGQFGISLMQNNSWVEGSGNASSPGATGISYSSLQSTYTNPALDQTLGVFHFGGDTSSLHQYPLLLSSGLGSDLLAGGEASLRVFAADDAVSYLFSSRAATALANRPQLLIDAVPEPGILPLVGIGFGLLLWRRRSTEPAR